MKLSSEKLIEMYRTMQTIRRFEIKSKEFYEHNLMRGTLHLCTGQEAVAVGACMALEPDDCITSTHRGHGHCISKGGDLRRMAAEIMGKETGYCHGRGGHMHMADFSKGMLGANAVVGGGIPIATGAAMGFRVLGQKRVALSFFGDGAANQGNFHESLNFAAIWKLPVIYLCENNLYASSTPAKDSLPQPDISVRGAPYNLPGFSVDGQDVLAVYECVSQAAVRARKGEGATLIEAKTYRYEGHQLGDFGGYQPEGELDKWKQRDPLIIFRQLLMKKGLLDEKGEQAIIKEVDAKIAEAEKFALSSPMPNLTAATHYVYKED